LAKKQLERKIFMQIKDFDFSVIVLCPQRNFGGLKATVGTAKLWYPNSDPICVVANDATKEEINEFKTLCPVYKGKDTITSLMNVGMKRIKNKWGMFVMAGARLTSCIDKKILAFLEDEKDIIYAIIDNKHEFTESSLNGLTINKKTFEEVGEFPTGAMIKEGFNDLEFAKLLWALDAIDKKCKFKAILGLKIV